MSHFTQCYANYNNRVTSHIWMSHVTHMKESCHTYEWVTFTQWYASYSERVTADNGESLLARFFFHFRRPHDDKYYVVSILWTPLQHTATHCNTLKTHCNTLQQNRRTPRLLPCQKNNGIITISVVCQTYHCVPWLTHMGFMTLGYVWHNSFSCVLVHVFTWVMKSVFPAVYLAYRCGTNGIRVTWLLYVCDMTHPYVYSSIYVHG